MFSEFAWDHMIMERNLAFEQILSPPRMNESEMLQPAIVTAHSI